MLTKRDPGSLALNDFEQRVLQMLADDEGTGNICEALGLSEHALCACIESIKSALGSMTVAGAVAIAFRAELIE